MAQTINADDGVISGSAGLKWASDGTAILSLQTKGTTALTVDGSQNVGIGTSSPGYKLDVNNTNGSAATARLNGNDQANVRLRLENGGSGGRTWEIVGGLPGANNANFSIRDVTGSTTPLTLDASGNLGVGTTSPGGPLQVATSAGQVRVENYSTGTKLVGLNSAASGEAIFGFQGNPLVFLTDGAERARITSGGVLCIGTTDVNGADCLSLEKSTIGNTSVGLLTVKSMKSGDAADCVASFVKFSNTNTTSQVFIKFGIDQYNSGSGQINANGASQAAFGSFSDSRLKENIVDISSQWANIKALRPVEFDYIASEGGGHQLGFIAQEVKEVYSDLVGERADGMLTLSGMGKNEARLIKALQEAMARIESLEAKVAALEAK